MSNFLDFNNVTPISDHQDLSDKYDIERIKDGLISQLQPALFYLFPNGEVRGNNFVIGNIHGEKGDSLVVSLKGAKAGLWNDFATGDGGDVLHLWGLARNLSQKDQFAALLKDISDWLGLDHSTFVNPKPKHELGAASKRWDYHDVSGNLIACVYRYDTDTGKQFRPWDVKLRKYKAPNPRPLYNQPAILNATQVILVEGEKAAEALINQGYIATTAMHGAKAPIDKTDWSPLYGKELIIWPDNDEAGKDYARNVAEYLALKCQVKVIEIPGDKPPKWDAFDAVEDKTDIKSLLVSGSDANPESSIDAFSLEHLWQDHSPMPDDLIAPRVLTPGGLLVFAGAPKVGKSDFILSWFSHLACGEPFIGMHPPRPLRIYYCQAEVQYDYLRERVQSLPLDEKQISVIGRNLFITSQLRMVLNDHGIDALSRSIAQSFKGKSPDIIAIDPIRNVFDGGEDGASENDNNAMMYFLTQRVEKLARKVNPNCGVILVHHTRKMSKKQLEEDPFQALSGASSMRGFYTSGMLLFKPDEEQTERHLFFELRNGASPNKKAVDKVNDKWIEYEPQNERLTHQKYGEKLDAERDRKRDVIIQLIAEEASHGRLYSANQFAETFENKASLGGNKTIRERISVLSTKGHIKFLKDGEPFGYHHIRSKFGILCVQGMEFITEDGEVLPVLPSHFKCPQTGAVLPVENPSVWVMQDEEVCHD